VWPENIFSFIFHLGQKVPRLCIRAKSTLSEVKILEYQM